MVLGKVTRLISIRSTILHVGSKPVLNRQSVPQFLISLIQSLSFFIQSLLIQPQHITKQHIQPTSTLQHLANKSNKRKDGFLHQHRSPFPRRRRLTCRSSSGEAHWPLETQEPMHEQSRSTASRRQLCRAHPQLL